MLFKKDTEFWFQIIFTKKEFDLIKNNFYWAIGPEDLVTNYEDQITGKQLKVFKNVFTAINQDFDVDDYEILFYSVRRFFTVAEFCYNRFAPIHKGPCPKFYEQITPLNNRPTFTYGVDSILEWFHEYGIYKKTRLSDKLYWFIHPKTHSYLFKEEKDYFKFIHNYKRNSKEAEKMNEKFENQMFIRLINVYDKFTKELKYRIINDEFLESGLSEFLNPEEGDEILLFRSYKVTQEIADFMVKMYDNKIDFDFSKNEYYLETLSANDFIYSYEDLIKDLDIIN